MSFQPLPISGMMQRRFDHAARPIQLINPSNQPSIARPRAEACVKLASLHLCSMPTSVRDRGVAVPFPASASGENASNALEDDPPPPILLKCPGSAASREMMPIRIPLKKPLPFVQKLL